jgi:hypothetical protein
MIHVESVTTHLPLVGEGASLSEGMTDAVETAGDNPDLAISNSDTPLNAW